MEFESTFREIAFTILRFGSFAAHGLLFGIVAILWLVLRPSYADLSDERWNVGRKRLSERLEGLVQASLVASVASTIALLLLHSSLSAELRAEELGLDSLSSTLQQSFGRWYALRLPIAFALGTLLVSRVRKWALAGAGDGRRAPSNVWWGLWAGLSGLLLATSTFSGHSAVATPRPVALANDIIHLLAGSVWFAGIIILAVVLPDGWRKAGPGARLELLAHGVSRFARVAIWAIAVVAGTGTVNSFLHVGKPSHLVDTSYGRALALKIALFLGVIALGGINHFFVERRLTRALERQEATKAPGLFRKTIAIELILALGLMSVTGLLTGLGRTRKDGAGAPAPVSSEARP